jgi:hypothetical protein
MDFTDIGAGEAGMSDGDLAKVMGAVSGLPAPVAQGVLSLGDAMGKALGLKSNFVVIHTCATPYTTAVRGLLLALRATKHGINAAFDSPKGAYVEAQLPRDFFSLGGTVQFDISETANDTASISAKSEIQGQKFDWGKGKRALNEVFAKADQFARRL